MLLDRKKKKKNQTTALSWLNNEEQKAPCRVGQKVTPSTALLTRAEAKLGHSPRSWVSGQQRSHTSGGSLEVPRTW